MLVLMGNIILHSVVLNVLQSEWLGDLFEEFLPKVDKQKQKQKEKFSHHLK